MFNPTCFTGDTEVYTSDGLVCIEEISVGDEVLAYDYETGETELKEVLNVWVKETDEILHVSTSDGETIDTTTNHPFYVEYKGWVAAGDLVVGDTLVTVDGDEVEITDVQLEKLAEPILVYNLEVEDFHTYFVGEYGVLVHNSYKSDHASKRQSEGRNVGSAINDLQRSSPSDIFIQVDDGRYVVRGGNVRIHIWESFGELVTTFQGTASNLSKRISSGRYRSLTNDELKEFAAIFGEYLNGSWKGYF